MKFKYVTMLGLVTLLNTASIGTAFGQQSPNYNTNAIAINQVAAKVLSKEVGNFQAAEHPTQGKVSIITHRGKRYIEFDRSFKTDHGPDLFVILHRDRTLPISGLKKKDYVSIARLRRVQGRQRYELPQNINVANFKSVAIWCRKFNATFGFATLNL